MTMTDPRVQGRVEACLSVAALGIDHREDAQAKRAPGVGGFDVLEDIFVRFHPDMVILTAEAGQVLDVLLTGELSRERELV